MNGATRVGDFFSAKPGGTETGIRILNHAASLDVIKNKIVLENYLFSLLVEGTKLVHTAENCTVIDSEQFPLFLSGNYLMTEKITSSAGRFQSILLFFTQNALDSFFSKYTGINITTRNIKQAQLQVFTKDLFLHNYIQSLLLLFAEQKEIPATLQKVKLEELLLYLCNYYPEKMQSLKQRAKDSTAETEIRKLAESNIGNNITIEELAFLCNMSLSTFKRKFIKLYGVAPSKWFLQKRMELATALLRTGKETPAEIYYKVGYETHSSFTHSFKQVFGLTPTEYREQILT